MAAQASEASIKWGMGRLRSPEEMKYLLLSENHAFQGAAGTFLGAGSLFISDVFCYNELNLRPENGADGSETCREIGVIIA